MDENSWRLAFLVSDRMPRCHRGDSGSIPGRRIEFRINPRPAGRASLKSTAVESRMLHPHWQMINNQVIQLGLEPRIPGSVYRCRIRKATAPEMTYHLIQKLHRQFRKIFTAGRWTLHSENKAKPGIVPGLEDSESSVITITPLRQTLDRIKLGGQLP